MSQDLPLIDMDTAKETAMLLGSKFHWDAVLSQGRDTPNLYKIVLSFLEFLTDDTENSTFSARKTALSEATSIIGLTSQERSDALSDAMDRAKQNLSWLNLPLDDTFSSLTRLVAEQDAANQAKRIASPAPPPYKRGFKK